MKNASLPLLSALLLSLALTAPAAAQTTFGLRAGVADHEPMIGVEAIVPLTRSIILNPNLEFTSELISANIDAHYDFDINRGSSFWFGGGIAFVKPDVGDSDVGINLLGGIGTRMGSVYPYLQAKITSQVDNSDYGSIALGVRF